MSEEEEALPNVFVTMELDTGPMDFESLEEVEEWLEAERGAFSWLGEATGLDGNTAPARKNQDRMFGIISQFITECRQHTGNEAARQNAFIQLESALERYRSNGHLVTSKSAVYQFLNDLRATTDAAVAAYAMCFLFKFDINQSNVRALKGAISAFLYLRGEGSFQSANTKALSGLLDDWNEKHTKRHRELESENHKLVKELESRRSALDALFEEITTQKDSQAKEFSEKFAEVEGTLSDIAKTYDEKLALQSSVSYWTGKRSFHTKIMKSVGIATLILALVTGGGFIYAAAEFLDAKPSEIVLWRIGVVLAISTFGIWITRLATKIFISNLHLRTDADERVTMIQTYLALLREGSGPKDDERQLILQTLFRPSSTGFIADEGPTGFQEAIFNFLARKK